MKGGDAGPHRWRVLPQAAGQRLDAYLSHVYETPRNQTARWIREGLVTVGARTAKPALRLEGGEWISCEPAPISQEGVLEPEQGEITLLHVDPDLLVIDKPPGLVVHPGAGNDSGTLVHRLLARFPEIATVGGPGRPGIVHRLDKGTSGVMVVARTPEAYLFLSRAFAAREIEKTYLAVAWGRPPAVSGTVDRSIARHPRRRKEMTISTRGRPAVTHYSIAGATDTATLFRLRLETGRTHQIRVHLKHLGNPIVGDPVYGEARWKSLPRKRQAAFREFERPALHAWRLRFAHPQSGDPVTFTAPLAGDMAELWLRIGGELPGLEEAPG